MKIKHRSLLIGWWIPLAFLTACGGSDSTSPPTTAPLIFTDGIMNGVAYDSQSNDGKTSYSGITDNSGVSQAIVSTDSAHDVAPITYTIAGGFKLTLSNLVQDSTMYVVSPNNSKGQYVHLIPLYTIRDITSDPNEITNIDTALETLSSTPAATGITITDNVRKAPIPAFNVSTQTLAQDILAIKSAADQADPSVTHTVPTPTQAYAHAQGSWLCAMSGYYSGSSSTTFIGPSGGSQSASMQFWIVVLPNGNTIGSATFSGPGPFNNSVAALNGTIQFPSQSLTVQATLTAPQAAPDTVTITLVWDGPRQFDTNSKWSDQNGTTGTISGSRQGIPTNPVKRFVGAPMPYTTRGYQFTGIMLIDVDASNNVNGSMWADVPGNPQGWAWQGTLNGNTLTAQVLTDSSTNDFEFAFDGTVDPSTGNITSGTLINYDNTPLLAITPQNPVLYCHM